MTLDPPRVTDQVTVGDAPEGLAISPTAGYAVPLLTNGAGNVPKNAFFHHDHAIAVLLKSDGKTMRKVGQTEVGTLSEGIAFSPDGRYVYVANWGEENLVPYRLEGDKLVAGGYAAQTPRPSGFDAQQHAVAYEPQRRCESGAAATSSSRAIGSTAVN